MPSSKKHSRDTHVFYREDIEKAKIKAGTILLPEFIFNKSYKWCWKNAQERQGVLLIKSQEYDDGFIYTIQAYITLGIGSAYHVVGDEKRVDALNAMLEDMRQEKDKLLHNLSVVSFHTHTFQTGSHWV